jgi:multicomponent Na+:H+ antiporter subunit E
MKMGSALLLNILVAVVWYALQPTASPGSFILGFCVGFALLTLLHHPYGRRSWAALTFIVFLVVAIVRSSFQVAAIILRPKLQLDQGIIAIPLTASSDFEIAALATSITLTPGTLSVDVGYADDGQRVLYVHNIFTGDPAAMRREIKDEFERRILRFTRTEGAA